MSSVSIIGKNLGAVEDEFTYEDTSELAALIACESWAPGVFKERKRTIANLSRIDLIVLDVDSGCSLEQAKAEFKNFKHIIATTRSHQKEKNGEVCDRFRVVLFLDSPLFSDKDFKATWEVAQRRWPFIDGACKDSSRFFYPSPTIISINQAGTAYPAVLASSSQSSKTPARPDDTGTSVKGDLWKSTLALLIDGAPPGSRHTALVSAVGNMREQGYSKTEVIEKLTTMIENGGDWTQPHLSRIDMNTIDRMFNRDMKYGFVPKPEPIESPAIIVHATELLDETFAYLSDKDKVKGEPTGIDGLDTLLGGGFRTGELTVLMAQGKTGKNTLYHYLIYKHLERGLPFGYASRELSPAKEVLPNFLSIAMNNNAWKSNINDDYKSQAKAIVSNWALSFAPGYGYFPVEEMEEWFKALKDSGVDHFLFDHFHYALLSEDHDNTTTLIKKLKAITKELDIHLSLIVQPRSLREGEQLSLSTLRGGAAIGQALDNLLILERVKGETNISKLTLEVARHKLAKLGHLYLQYDTNTTSFIEVAKELVHEPARIPQGVKPRHPWPNIASI